MSKDFTTTYWVENLLSTLTINRALTLSAYDYEISYKPGKNRPVLILSADFPYQIETPTPADTILLIESLQTSPTTFAHIRSWTSRNPLLSKVRKMLLQGWQFTIDEALKPFQRRKDELSVQDGCILWGSLVVIPPPGRQKVIDKLHAAHPGISRMKSLARSSVWWPHIDEDLEAKVKNCRQCQESQKHPPAVPMQNWEWPAQPCPDCI